ncbi:MAG: tetratricopeptide repeat protein [Candidatus Latescibacterota bacterium]|nr:tetratricopeptide repeat protein [Candidatus Latescibacterota bacterium]
MADRLAKLEKVYRRNPDSPLFARLADLYLKRGKTEHALEICLQGCQKFPEYATGFMVLARCYEAGGAVEKARDALDQALRIDPVNPKGYERLSAIYHKLGVPTLALKTLQQAALLDPFAEELPSRVDELTYEVRLESTRESDVGEVDPYVTPDQATAGVAASDAPEAAAESAPDEAVEGEPTLNGEQDISVGDGDSVSEAQDAGQVAECETGKSVSNDEASDFGVVISEGDENGPSEPDEDGHDGLNESTAVVGDKGTEPDEDDLFTYDDEECLQDGGGETTLDGRSAETRLVAGLGEGFEGADWDGDEESPALNGDISADKSSSSDVAEQSGTEVVESGDASERSGLEVPDGMPNEREEPTVEISAEQGREEVESAGGEEDESEEAGDGEEHGHARGSGLGTRGDDELLRLFQEIETQGSDEVDAPIEVGDLVDISAEEERQRITTPTLAEIYTIQGLTQKAIETYRELLDQDPNNDFIRRKLEELESSGSKK